MFNSRLVYIIISLCLLVCLVACGNEILPQESVPSETLQPLKQTNLRFDSELPEGAATISFVEGDVRVLRVDIANWEDAVTGMELKLEDMIETGDDGTAVIVFFEGSTIELEPNTEVMIQELGIAPGAGSTTIKLWQNIGSTVNRVQKLVDSESRYEIQTPSGSAVVRGSVGRVIVLPNGVALIYNESGQWWAYSNGQWVPIPPDYYIIIIQGNPPGPLIPGLPQPYYDPYAGNGEDFPEPVVISGISGTWTQSTVADFSAGIPQNTLVIDVGGGDGSIVLDVEPQSIFMDQAALIIPESETWTYDICGTRYLAQTFSAGMWGSLVQVNLGFLQSYGSPAPLVVEIRNCILVDDYYVPGSTVLARTALDNINGEGTYTAYFSPPAGIIAGQNYSIVLYQQGNGGVVEEDYYMWGTQYYYDTYQMGTGVLSDDSGVSWWVMEGEVEEDFYFETYVGQYFTEGTFESSVYDCGGNVIFGTISWDYFTVDSGSVKFQVATNTDGTTWNFVGPDGTSTTFYETSGTALWNGHWGDRFIKYKTYLTVGSMGITPELKSITISY